MSEETIQVLTEKQQQEIIADAIEKIKATIVDRAVSSASWDIEQALAGEIQALIREFVKAEIAPELTSSLQANKKLIIEAALVSAQDLALMLAKAMTDSAAEVIGSDYQRKKLIQTLFGYT